MYQTIRQTQTQLLKVPYVADILNCSKAYIYKLVKQGEIPSVQIGTAVRIRPQDLERYIRENLTGYQV
jgi:excisionase family DNA binding protein